MSKLLRCTVVFMAFSSCLLNAETSGSFAEWWNGKRTSDWFGASPALEDNGIKLTGKWIGVAAGGLD